MQEVFITDLEGKQIKITHVDKAIEQADGGRRFSHGIADSKESDRRIQAYWQDIYEKLK